MLSPFCLVYYSFDDRDIILLFKNLLKCDEKGLTLNAISIETGKILRNCLDNF